MPAEADNQQASTEQNAQASDGADASFGAGVRAGFEPPSPRDLRLEQQILKEAAARSQKNFQDWVSQESTDFRLSYDPDTDTVRVTSHQGHDFRMRTALSEFRQILDQPTPDEKDQEKAQQQKAAELQRQQQATPSNVEQVAGVTFGVLQGMATMAHRAVHSLFDDGVPTITAEQRSRRIAHRLGENRHALEQRKAAIKDNLAALRDPDWSPRSADLYERYCNATSAAEARGVRRTFQQEINSGEIGPQARDRVDAIMGDADDVGKLTQKVAADAKRNGASDNDVVEEVQSNQRFAEAIGDGPETDPDGKSVSEKLNEVMEQIKAFLQRFVNGLRGDAEASADAAPKPG